MDEHTLGEAPEPEALIQRRAPAAKPRGFCRATNRRIGVAALKGPPRKASGAHSARLRERAHDVVANAKLRHLRADGSHDSGDLVTQYGRRRKDGVGGDRQVGVTEPRGSNLDENFAAGGRCALDV